MLNLMNPFSLEGKRALVTGASKGLGYATAQQLKALGAEVIVSARGQDELEIVALELGAKAVSADVSTLEGVQKLKDVVGAVDILVINAGGPKAGGALSVTESDWDAGYQLTFLSAVRLVEAFLPAMREQCWGRIIAITSMTVTRPNPNLVVSNALRAAVTNYLRTLALEVAQENITVNTVAPGFFATERLNSLYNDSQMEAVKNSVPMNRIGDPLEFGAAVAFLASCGASYITGQSLEVNGGFGIR